MLSTKIIYKRVPDLKMLLTRGVHKSQRKSYYDLLGLSPKATQAEIKKAYYKMSIVYHPDRQTAGSPDMFREISAAYEVLGNQKLRKLYDKGLLPSGAAGLAAAQESKESSGTDEQGQEERQDRQKEFYQKPNPTNFEEARKRKGPYTGKTEQFDYDAWTQSHYSETFTRRERQRAASYDMEMNKFSKRFRQWDAAVTLLFILTVAGVILHLHRITHYDYPGNSLKRKS